MQDFSTVTAETASTVIGNIATWFFILGAGACVVASIQVRFLSVVSTRLGIRLRRKYFRSLLSQERAWHDRQATVELTACSQ